jgi:hypothetical protein
MPIYGYKREGRAGRRSPRALRGAVYGFLVAPACGFVLGFSFGMPTMDLPAPPGLNGAFGGAAAFAILFGWLTATVGMLIALLIPKQ